MHTCHDLQLEKTHSAVIAVLICRLHVNAHEAGTVAVLLFA